LHFALPPSARRVPAALPERRTRDPTPVRRLRGRQVLDEQRAPTQTAESAAASTELIRRDHVSAL